MLIYRCPWQHETTLRYVPSCHAAISDRSQAIRIPPLKHSSPNFHKSTSLTFEMISQIIALKKGRVRNREKRKIIKGNNRLP